MPATLKINKEFLLIETDFGYTYKIIKSEKGLQLEESFDEQKALETPPIIKEDENTSEKGSIFDWGDQ